MGEDRFPLAPEQRSVLEIDRIYGPRIQHNLTATVELVDDTPLENVRAAVRALGLAHPGLTAIVEPSTFQQRLSDSELAVQEIPIDGSSIEARVKDLRDALPRRDSAPRVTAEVLRAERKSVLLLALDHLICDDAGRRILVDELRLSLQRGRVGGLPNSLTSPTSAADDNYPEHCRRTSAQNWERELAYWEESLAEVSAHSGYSQYDLKPDSQWLAHDLSWSCLSDLPGERVRKIADSAQTSIFAAVMAILVVSIARISGDSTPKAIVTPVSNRAFHGSPITLCNQVNERLIPYDLQSAADIVQLAKQIGNNLLRSIYFARMPLNELIAESPRYRSVLAGDRAEYVQLQVDRLDSVAQAPSLDPSIRGLYEPSIETTCNVFRIGIAPDGVSVSAFFGGPPKGYKWIEETVSEIFSIMQSSTNLGSEF